MTALPVLSAKDLTTAHLKHTVVTFMMTKKGAAALTSGAEFVDMATDGALKKLIKNRRTVGEKGGVLVSDVAAAKSKSLHTAVVIGLGDVKKLTARDWLELGIKAGKQLDALGCTEGTVALGDTADATMQDVFAEGLLMALGKFDDYKTEIKAHQKPALKAVSFLVDDFKGMAKRLPLITALLEAQGSTRHAVNLPSNVANPEYMAVQAKKLTKLGVKVDVLDEKKLDKLGMNLMMAVGKGASKADQPRLITMTYNGGKKTDKPIAVVGKGVMFDTGGYNVKTGPYMGGMKCDMGGAAVVLGLMEALAKRKAKVNVVGVMGCAMNMINENAFKPDDIFTGYKGLSVEIGNTDAEGRMVLADAIAYTIDKQNPAELIDLATLTGAVMGALGGAYAGLFSTSDTMADNLTAAGKASGEHVWRLPIDDCYAAKPTCADLNNDGSAYGGASTAAVFLKRFADKTPWAHLDIAGVTMAEKRPVPGMIPVGGATGFGVRLLTRYFENK